MKAAALYVAIFALALLTIPLIALNYDMEKAPEMQAPTHSPSVPENLPVELLPDSDSDADSADTQADASAGDSDGEPQRQVVATPASQRGVDSFLIKDTATGQVNEVSLQDFVRGAVAAEMPVSFHPEALKAQAVAAHTFALHNHLVQEENADSALNGADFEADPSGMKVYITEAQAKAFYGENGDRYWEKICEAADSVLPYVLEYDDEPIVAAYHAISAGQTEDAANVWTGSAPYLQSADSPGDILAPDYETTVTLSTQELRELLLAAYPDLELQEDPGEWFGDETRSESGYVVEIQVGGQTLHGKELRELLGLRSHNFDVLYTDTGFTFDVYGYGHGVGLSQYGADFLARQGKTFDEILDNYYTGAALKMVEVA